jgi:hypothetical protein
MRPIAGREAKAEDAACGPLRIEREGHGRYPAEDAACEPRRAKSRDKKKLNEWNYGLRDQGVKGAEDMRAITGCETRPLRLRSREDAEVTG